MTQNKFILGFTSLLIVLVAFIYVASPFKVTRVYANEKTFAANLPDFKQHTIIIYFTLDGITNSQTFHVTLDDDTFVKLFVDNQFLPSPPFTVFAY